MIDLELKVELSYTYRYELAGRSKSQVRKVEMSSRPTVTEVHIVSRTVVILCTGTYGGGSGGDGVFLAQGCRELR